MTSVSIKMDEHFYVTFTSSALIKLFPENTLDEYTTQLCKPLAFRNEDYEVFLCECIIQANLCNVLKPLLAIEVTKYVDKIEKHGYIFLPKVYYVNVNDIISARNAELKSPEFGTGMYLTYVSDDGSGKPLVYDSIYAGKDYGGTIISVFVHFRHFLSKFRNIYYAFS